MADPPDNVMQMMTATQQPQVVYVPQKSSTTRKVLIGLVIVFVIMIMLYLMGIFFIRSLFSSAVSASDKDSLTNMEVLNALHHRT